MTDHVKLVEEWLNDGPIGRAELAVIGASEPAIRALVDEVKAAREQHGLLNNALADDEWIIEAANRDLADARETIATLTRERDEARAELRVHRLRYVANHDLITRADHEREVREACIACVNEALPDCGIGLYGRAEAVIDRVLAERAKTAEARAPASTPAVVARTFEDAVHDVFRQRLAYLEHRAKYAEQTASEATLPVADYYSGLRAYLVETRERLLCDPVVLGPAPTVIGPHIDEADEKLVDALVRDRAPRSAVRAPLATRAIPDQPPPVGDGEEGR